MALTAASIQQNRTALMRAYNEGIGTDKDIFKPHIKNTGPANYPLVFTDLILAITTLLFTGAVAVMTGRTKGPSTAVLAIQIILALFWTAVTIFAFVAFALLTGPPNRAECGFGESNLMDSGHNSCGTTALEISWFAISCVLFVVCWVGVAVLAIARKQARRSEEVEVRIQKLQEP